MLPQVLEGEVVQPAQIIDSAVVIHNRIAGLGGRRLTIFRVGAPDPIVQRKDRPGEKEQTDHSRRHRHCGGEIGSVSSGGFGHQPNENHAHGQQKQRANPPEQRESQQHIGITHALVGIANIRQPHDFVEKLVIAGLGNCPCGKGKVADAIENPATQPGQNHGHGSEDQSPTGREGINQLALRLQQHPGEYLYQKIAEPNGQGEQSDAQGTILLVVHLAFVPSFSGFGGFFFHGMEDVANFLGIFRGMVRNIQGFFVVLHRSSLMDCPPGFGGRGRNQ